MREARGEIESHGVSIVVIGTGADWQAARLMHDGMPFECLVDPDANFYQALEIGRVGIGEWFRPTTMRRYVDAYARGARQGLITGDCVGSRGLR